MRERRAASLLQAADSAPLDDPALQRIARRLAARPVAPRPVWRSWAVAMLAFGLVLLATGAVVARTRVGARLGGRLAGLFSARVKERPAPPAAPTFPSAPASRNLAARSTVEKEVIEPALGPIAAPSPERPAPIDPPARGPSTDGSRAAPLAQEAQLIARALRQVGPRSAQSEAHDALATLDRYRTRFPDGLLREEAARARVTALLRLGRTTEALFEIEDGTTRAGLRPADEVLRAELRAQAGRCAEALEDFRRLLAASPDRRALEPGLRERCLYGQAICLAHVGRTAEARAGLRAYLDEYASGLFVEQARAALFEPGPVR